jgi:hypothetical protein
MYTRNHQRPVSSMKSDEILSMLTREDYAVRSDIGAGLSNFLKVFPPSQVSHRELACISASW